MRKPFIIEYQTLESIETKKGQVETIDLTKAIGVTINGMRIDVIENGLAIRPREGRIVVLPQASNTVEIVNELALKRD